MFKDKTKEAIHEAMMKEISDQYDKTQGSFIYDATMPAAMELEEIYGSLGKVVDKLRLENLSGEELEERIHQVTGISRKPATRATGFLQVKGNGTIHQGALFETQGGITFEAVESGAISGVGLIKIQCSLAGIIGNVPANQITRMPVTLGGITEVNNPEALTGGFEAETDQALLQRYYERIKTPATSGNRAHYKNWAKEVQGVDDARVFPLWKGPNTVKVVIVDALRGPAGDEIVERVQEYIDPGVKGLGEGVAPIGALCTVVSATPKTIDISLRVNRDSAYTAQQVLENITEGILQYLRNVTFTEDYISYAMIGSIILQADGVIDYADLRLNNDTVNVILQQDEVAVLGEVKLDEWGAN